MQEPSELALPAAEAPDEMGSEALAAALGVPLIVAKTLRAAGIHSPETARATPVEELRALGLSDDELTKVLGAAPPPPSAGVPAPDDPPGALPAADAEPSPSAEADSDDAPVTSDISIEIEPPTPPDSAEAPTPTPSPPPGPEATEPAMAAAPGSDAQAGAAMIERWRKSAQRGDRTRRRPRPATPGSDSTEVLRKWVQGDDGAMESWIQSSEETRPLSPAVGPSPSDAAPATGSGEETAGGATALPGHLVEREETVVRWLTDLLDRVKTDQFDPSSILQELQELQRSLYDERERKAKVEEELEHVKRGSVAVIKYVRTREAKAREELTAEKDAEIAELRRQLESGGTPATGAPAGPEPPRPGGDARHRSELASREADFAEREGELRRKVVDLEGQLRAAQAAAGARGPPTNLSADREAQLQRRENDLRTKFEEIRIRAEELERKRDAITYKEQEISGREDDISLRQKALEIEARRVAEAKSGLPKEALEFHPEKAAMAAKLEELENALARKEEEIQKRELFLKQKLGEVEELTKKAAEQEADRIQSEAVEETKGVKVKSGVRRLDDLLFGGLPAGSQILVNGPAHTGKDILARLFLAEGLKQGQGALWILTDRTYGSVREEMTALLPNYPEFEKRGLVRYVDLYSKSLGVNEAERGVKLLSSTDKALLEQLMAASNAFTNELKERAKGYRIVFESVSTVTAYLDSAMTFRFLQPLIGRRKLDGAAGYYEIETGMHSESDLQTLEHMMDGSVNLKIDQLKTFLSVRGITDVQSRAWVGYTFTKKAFNLGSFSLDHIR